jgi:DNA-binding transcriptional LysR family regulator
MQFVAQGVGISFATRSLAATGFDGISFRELADDRFYVESALAYRADDRSEILQQFIRFVRERFRQHT